MNHPTSGVVVGLIIVMLWVIMPFLLFVVTSEIRSRNRKRKRRLTDATGGSNGKHHR